MYYQDGTQQVTEANMMKVGGYSFDDYYGGDLSDASSYDHKYNTDKGTKDPVKAAKKLERKKKEHAQRLLIMMPLLMFSGAGRLMLSAENKRSLIKMT